MYSKIVQDGVLEPLVSITSCRPHGPARSVAVELLRLISDGISSDKWAWEKLCRSGAAKALAGNVLSEAIQYLSDDGHTLNFTSYASFKSAVQEISSALQCLANLLEPFPNNEVAEPLDSDASYIHKIEPFKGCLDLTCNETAKAGGVSSLLSIAALSLQPLQNSMAPMQVKAYVDLNCLLLESYRALASLCHYLLSTSSAEPGLARLAVKILPQLSKALMLNPSDEKMDNIIEELQVTSLRGLRSLSKYFPMKSLIIQSCLPQLFQLKKSRKGASCVAQYATQVCLDLPLSVQDMEAIGNNLRSWSLWFHLEHSLVLQALVKHEIRVALFQTWKSELGVDNAAASEKHRHALDDASHSSEKAVPYTSMDKEISLLQQIFPNVSEDALIPLGCRAEFVRQYATIYDPCDDLRYPQSIKSFASTEESATQRSEQALSKEHFMEEWILLHKRAMKSQSNSSSSNSGMLSTSYLPLDRRVQEILDIHFPSPIIQSEVLPLFDLQRSASFDFIGLDMPQQKYFSFRREGQVVQRICEQISSRTDPTSRFWTLGFKNSSFGGEFAETLVQTLYRCRNIRSISFANTQCGYEVEESERGKELSQTLRLLMNKLPPWVTYLTFDNFQSQHSLSEFLNILMKMGLRNTQTLEALAIRNYGRVRSVNLDSFIDQIYCGGFIPLRLLDLSENNLGDKICSRLLALVLDENSGCTLERLDLSGNSIGKGDCVISALEAFASGGQRASPSQLRTLNLASNDLCKGNVCRQIISMLGNDCLKISSLSLANNGITGDEQGIHDAFFSALTNNTKLIYLDLSHNKFRRCFFDRLLNSDSKTGLGFINLEGNDPPLRNCVLRALHFFVKQGQKSQVFQLKRQLHNTDSWMNSKVPGNSYATTHPRMRPTQSDSAILVEPWKKQTSKKVNCFLARKAYNEKGDKQASKSNSSNKLTVLFSAPLGLMINDLFKPVEADLDFQGERELLWQSFREASMDIDLSFDTATTDRLIAARSRRCSCIHYSGHGYPKHLAFENGMGGLHWLSVEQLKNVISSGSGGEAPFNFVFVSACYSLNIGQTFVDAGTCVHEQEFLMV